MGGNLAGFPRAELWLLSKQGGTSVARTEEPQPESRCTIVPKVRVQWRRGIDSEMSTQTSGWYGRTVEGLDGLGKTH